MGFLLPTGRLQFSGLDRPWESLGFYLGSEPSPVKRAVMKQGWYDLAYIHFRYDPHEVQRLLAPGLSVDVFDGSAWVGLIPFSMRGIGIPHLASVPYLGSFPASQCAHYISVAILLWQG